MFPSIQHSVSHLLHSVFCPYDPINAHCIRYFSSLLLYRGSFVLSKFTHAWLEDPRIEWDWYQGQTSKSLVKPKKTFKDGLIILSLSIKRIIRQCDLVVLQSTPQITGPNTRKVFWILSVCWQIYPSTFVPYVSSPQNSYWYRARWREAPAVSFGFGDEERRGWDYPPLWPPFLPGGRASTNSVANRAFLMPFSEKLAFFETWGIFLC